MRLCLLGLAFVAAPAVAATTQPNSVDTPGRATIEKIEATLAFWRDVEDVGVPGVIATKSQNWRVKIRSLNCRLIEAQAQCSYETRPCFHPPMDKEKLDWCGRERRFRHGYSSRSFNGWQAVPEG